MIITCLYKEWKIFFTRSDSVRSSAYSDGAARLPHLSIIRTQLLPHPTMHHRRKQWRSHGGSAWQPQSRLVERRKEGMSSTTGSEADMAAVIFRSNPQNYGQDLQLRWKKLFGLYAGCTVWSPPEGVPLDYAGRPIPWPFDQFLSESLQLQAGRPLHISLTRGQRSMLSALFGVLAYFKS